MTTGEKIAFLRKKASLTQEQMAEILGVSRQSVSRWEIDMAFPETEKLIKMSKLLRCSIDYLLNTEGNLPEEVIDENPSVAEAYEFICACGYFFLATSNEGKPNQRPMGMIYYNGKSLYIATDKRKKLFHEVEQNPQISIASYNLSNRKWLRLCGSAEEETSISIYKEMEEMFPKLKQKYIGDEEYYFVILKITVETVDIN